MERAVAAIETTILGRNPELKNKKFTVECRKVVVADGVKHEMDVFVRIDRGDGYDSTFIFECKNLAENVGKNEIIVFSEKIRAVSANRGFFVAKGYGEYARAQAAKNPRVALLDATETSLHIGALMTLSVEVRLGSTLQVSLSKCGFTDIVRPLKKSCVIYAGKRTIFEDFMKTLAEDLTKQRLEKPDVKDLSPGEHNLQMIGDLSFREKLLLVDHQKIEKIRYRLSVSYKRLFPRFKGGFEIADRGSYLEFDEVEIMPGQSFVDIHIVH